MKCTGRIAICCFLLTSLAATQRLPAEEGKAKEALVELKAVNSPDRSVTAHWMGKQSELDKMQRLGLGWKFAVEKLRFTFAGDQRVYKLKADLASSELHTEIFSPDGAFIVLQKGQGWTFSVIRVDRLKAYLRGDLREDRVAAKPPELFPKDKDGIFAGAIYGFYRWTSGRVFQFRAICCGWEERFSFDVVTGETEFICRAPAYGERRRLEKLGEPWPGRGPHCKEDLL